MDEEAEGKKLPVTLTMIERGLCDDQSLAQAIDLAVAGLANEADCEQLVSGIRTILEMLDQRLGERIGQIMQLSDIERLKSRPAVEGSV